MNKITKEKLDYILEQIKKITSPKKLTKSYKIKNNHKRGR